MSQTELVRSEVGNFWENQSSRQFTVEKSNGSRE